MTMNVRVEKQADITTVIIDRPDVRNAIDRPTADALVVAFEEFEQDKQAKVAILYGDHGCFCAGADLKAVADQTDGFDLSLEKAPLGISRMQLSKPVIAAVSGYAVAGGLELALWCDLRVVEKTAIMGVFCRRWGVPLVDGGTIRLPRLIGLSRAMDLILTGRPVEAEEALVMGLANRVVEDGCAREEAEKLAKQLAQFPQQCLRHDRLSAQQQFGMDFEAAIQNEREHGLAVLNSGETLAGAKRFDGGQGRHGSFED